MQVLYSHCCGLDVHKKNVVACLIITDHAGRVRKEIRTFGTMTQELLALADWLGQAQCTHVAMESTGVYWKPVYNLLEDQFELLVVNAQHLKAVPGRKTDVNDAQWIADLLRHGLVCGSFVPPAAQRELRDLTRQRTTLVAERARIINRVQKVLEDANVKLASVVSDIRGLSARAMLEAILGGETDPEKLAELARGRLRPKRDQLAQALLGRVRPHHCFLLTEHLSHIDYLDEAIAQFSDEIGKRLESHEEVIELLDTIPGLSRRSAEILLAEIGTEIARFPSAKHLASWAGMCPGQRESAGKRKSGKTRKGDRWLRQVLIEAAHGAASTKKTYLGALYRRLGARRGKKKALVAVGHAILVIVYHVLKHRMPYQELGHNYFDERDRQAVKQRLVKRLEGLGFNVELTAVEQAA